MPVFHRRCRPQTAEIFLFSFCNFRRAGPRVTFRAVAVARCVFCRARGNARRSRSPAVLSPQRKETFFGAGRGARFAFLLRAFRFFRSVFLLSAGRGCPRVAFLLFSWRYARTEKRRAVSLLFSLCSLRATDSLCSEVVGVRSDHDDRVVRGIAVVVFAHRDVAEAVGAVECLGGGVLPPDLEKENFQPAGF